jgi:hypothetical protein
VGNNDAVERSGEHRLPTCPFRFLECSAKRRTSGGSCQLTVKFEVIGRLEGNANSGNLIRFWAKQTVRLHFAKTLTVDFEALDVCVTP